jgi:hypothetical protein
MNILQLSEALKGVPKDFLIKEATMPSGNYPQFLVVSELSRRTAMEKQFAGIAAQQNQPQETVADRTVREATPTPMAAMQGIKSPQTTYQEEPSGQETMGVPGAVRMFEGGRVAFAPGGVVSMPKSATQMTIDRLNKQIADAQARSGSGIMSRFFKKDKLIERLTAERDRLVAQQREEANKAFDVDPNTMFEYERDAAIERNDYKVVKPPEGNKPGEYGNFIDDQTNQEIVPPEGYDPSITAKAIEERQDTTFDEFRKMRESQKDSDATSKQATDQKTKKTIEEQMVDQVTEDPVIPDTSDMKSLADEEALNQIQSYLGPKPEVKNTDDYMKSIENMRKGRPDYLAKVAERTAKLEEGIEKDKKMAVPMSLIQAGLAIATASPGQGLLGAIAEGGKRGIAEFTNLRKEVRQAEKEFMSAQNEMDLAKAARQEGDIKTAIDLEKQAQQNLNNYNTQMANAAIKIQDRMATDKRFYYGVKAEAVARKDAQQFEYLKAQFLDKATQRGERVGLVASIFDSRNKMLAQYDQMETEIEGASKLDYPDPNDKLRALASVRQAKKNMQKRYDDFISANNLGMPTGRKAGGKIEAPEKKSRRSVFDFT